MQRKWEPRSKSVEPLVFLSKVVAGLGKCRVLTVHSPVLYYNEQVYKFRKVRVSCSMDVDLNPVILYYYTILYCTVQYSYQVGIIFEVQVQVPATTYLVGTLLIWTIPPLQSRVFPSRSNRSLS